ncbi:hypothetical protein D918_00351 [Trichuris suis]|uniref:Uncharacterized protein n=1 Tax=Trichuris suis TaxID=68888 RepID=A0A085MK27_9BILA|nr:hypothetical protein M513_01676 [Trichuris suis]KHJ49230.1 hypothetical protein D918_00351 [Trichuris suis]
MKLNLLIISHFFAFLAAEQRVNEYFIEIKYEEKKQEILNAYPQAAKDVKFAESECEDMFREIRRLKSSTSFTLESCKDMGLEQAFKDTLMRMKMSRHERTIKYCQLLRKSPECITHY